MEINQELAVSAKEFFDFLRQSIVLDLKKTSGKEIKKDDIYEGMTYHKELATKIGRTGEAKVTISRFRDLDEYIAEFDSNQGKNITAYKIEDLGADKIHVNYREDFIAADRLKGLNFKLMNLFYKKRACKQASDRLTQIENYLISQRKNQK